MPLQLLHYLQRDRTITKLYLLTISYFIAYIRSCPDVKGFSINNKLMINEKQGHFVNMISDMSEIPLFLTRTIHFPYGPVFWGLLWVFFCFFRKYIKRGRNNRK